MDDGTILVIGAGGQVGTELCNSLRDKYGTDHVIATDISNQPHLIAGGPFDILDVMDRVAIEKIISKYKVKHIFNLAAILSAKGEQNPKLAWNLNMKGLLNILDAARKYELGKIFWPSSIAVFGPNTPMDNTPQNTVMDPNTVYGISKLAGERWCEYYHTNHGVDVRSLRYPGLIGYGSQPGGGTTDYAVHIFYEAIAKGEYTCFLGPDTMLPMMYMEDALRATIELMEAPAEKIKVRSSYNIAGLSFSPAEIVAEIHKRLPDLKVSYAPDFRQKIADSWPNSIDDSPAREQWGWKEAFDLPKMVEDMLNGVESKITSRV